MFRREFFSMAAGSVAVVQKIDEDPELDQMLCRIESAVLKRLPGVKLIRVHYDPAHPELPLMILASRI
jgi:hypothetical protein